MIGIEARHAYVHQDGVERAALDGVDRVLAIDRLADDGARARQQLHRRGSHILVVLDDEDP